MIKTADLTPRQKQIAMAIGAILVFYLLFGFLGAPLIVRSVLENQVAEAIDRKVTVGPVRVNPITLSVTLRELEIHQSDGAAFVKLDEAYANLQTSSLFKWALVLKSVRLINPQISLVRTGEATFNFSDIGADEDTAPPDTEATADGGGFALAIYETRIADGRILIDDKVTAVAHRIEDLQLSVSDLSSRPADVEVTTLFKLEARINGAGFSLDGKTRPFAPTRETRADVGLADLNLPHYLPYVSLPGNLAIPSLTLAIESEIDFKILEAGEPEVVLAGLFTITDARLMDGNGDPFVFHPNLKLDLLPSKILSGQVRLAQVETSAAEYFLKRQSSGELYLPFLAVRAYEEAEDKAAQDPGGEFNPVVTVDAFDLSDGRVHFTDLANNDPFSTTITDLDLEIKNFGLNIDRTATYRLTLKSEADESMGLSGTAAFDPLQVSGKIDVSEVQVSLYAPYYKDRFDFKTLEGRLSLGGGYRVSQETASPRVSLSGVHLDLDRFEVVDEDDDEPLIAFERLSLSDTTLDLDRREVTLGHLALSKAQIACRREKDGSLNLVKAFVPRGDTDDSKADDAKVSDAKDPPETDPLPKPFVVNLEALEIAGLSLDVEDRVPAKPVTFRMDEITLEASNLSTAAGKAGKADLSLRWEQGGKLRAGGTVTIAPLALDMAIEMKKMDVRPFQPYLSEQVGLIVTQGFFNTQGRLALSEKQGAAPTITYGGTAGLNRFASIDRSNSNDFLKWEALLLDDLEVGINPTRLSIEQVSLAEFFARVIVEADGSVNLVSMFSDPASPGSQPGEGQVPATPPSSTGTKPPIRIARVSLSDGDVDFSDRFIKPNFNAKFNDLGGRISGLESIAEKRADVLLEGMWSKHAPVKITGQINPLIEAPYVNLNLNISDIELSPFSPYSGKYLGYVLEKGKLTFNVAYLMEDRMLEGKNSIFIDQLTLGDEVDSPEAVSLPIKLAVALLKDRNGNIELDLPVSGNMSDPEFKIGKVVLTVLKNLIVKIVTSPFAALGALAGGGEELSYLDFEAGASDINPENAEKMDKLATILDERPGLKLDIQGAAAPETDREALRAMLLENRLKAEKLRRMMQAGQSAVPLEEIVLDEAERPQILAAVFETAGVSLPADDSGKPIEATPQIMEQLLRTHTEVTDNDFRKLANTRAFSAKNHLLQDDRVARERVFIVEPGAGNRDADQDGAGKGQVIFSLK